MTLFLYHFGITQQKGIIMSNRKMITLDDYSRNILNVKRGSVSRRIVDIIRSYEKILLEQCPEFTEDEWKFMSDNVNFSYLTEINQMIPLPRAFMVMNIPTPLMNKFKNIKPTEKMALLDVLYKSDQERGMPRKEFSLNYIINAGGNIKISFK